MSSTAIERIREAIKQFEAVRTKKPVPLIETELAVLAKVSPEELAEHLDSMQAAGEVVCCAVTTGGIETRQVRTSAGPVHPHRVSSAKVLSPISKQVIRRAERAIENGGAPLRIAGSSLLPPPRPRNDQTPPKFIGPLPTISPRVAIQPAELKPIESSPAPELVLPITTDEPHATEQEKQTMATTQTISTKEQILELLQQSGTAGASVTDLAAMADMDAKQVGNALQRLRAGGRAEKIGHGVWRAAAAAPVEKKKKAGGRKPAKLRVLAKAEKKGAKRPSNRKAVPIQPGNIFGEDSSKTLFSETTEATVGYGIVSGQILPLIGGGMAVIRGNTMVALLDSNEVRAIQQLKAA